MSSNNDSIKSTITVALALCIVCSVVVSGAAVFLKPQQEANKVLDKKRNVLAAAGLLEPGKSVDELFQSIETHIVDLRTGQFTEEVSADSYDQRKASKDAKTSTVLSGEQDFASIKRREHFATVYIVKQGDNVEKIVLPVHGYGLWSTLYGFLALKGDFNTVEGLGFYEHGETPGLGGEVDNPKWKALWPGKQAFADDGSVALQVVKGSVDTAMSGAEHKVDGLSGATLTSRGVSNLIKFWLGEQGFGPFLANLRSSKGA